MEHSIKLMLETPCDEIWDKMPDNKNGRYFHMCNKNLIDFTVLSDDEIYRLVQNNSNICGRIKKSQINRPINRPLPLYKKVFKFYSRMTALIFGLFSFRPSIAQSNINQTVIEYKQNDTKSPNAFKASLRGKVTNKEGIGIKGVNIYMNKKLMCSTDKLGAFSFEINTDSSIYYTLYFSAANYMIHRVGYKPNLQNEEINVKLNTVDYVFNIKDDFMGIVVFKKLHNWSYKNRSLNKNLTNSKKLRTILEEVSSLALSEDLISMELIGYYSNDHQKQKRENQLREIINYLVNEKNVKRNVFILELKKNKKQIHNIEIKETEDAYQVFNHDKL